MNAVSEVVLSSARFRRELQTITIRAVLEDLGAIVPSSDPPDVDWGYALFACSAIALEERTFPQDAALRIAQACLTSAASEPDHRRAATVLLERLGNRPAVHLAENRDLVERDAWEKVPLPLQLDVVRHRLELTIPSERDTTLNANPFQRQFWTAASRNDWISVSAPTSAGKSYIVRKWLGHRISGTEAFTAIYLVPTRALIEEVSLELSREFKEAARIFTLPWDEAIAIAPQRILVMTQERLHLLFERLPSLEPDLVFVDEAQKFNDDARGVLLQRVVDESVRRNPSAQVMYASPLTENPEVLLEGAPTSARTTALLSEIVTVNQNLLWVNQVPYRPKHWSVDLIDDSQPYRIGHVDLPGRANTKAKRLSLVAVAVGGNSGGNVVYVNGAADAEKVAQQIFDARRQSTEEVAANSAVADLIDLVKKTIHPDYQLARVLERQVAFHYGNMPLLVRAEIERLFKIGAVQYLVCTSTLLEGVNLPCRNVFVRGPRRGQGRPMSAADFWNLAGRAGRWGKEFQGNIVCIDTDDSAQWPDPPRTRKRQPIERAVGRVSSDVDALIQYIERGTPVEESRQNRLLEAVFSLLSVRYIQRSSLEGVHWLDVDASQRERLEHAIGSALRTVEVNEEVVGRHAGISALSMQDLLTYFRGKEDVESVLIALPESNDAAVTYVSALSRTERYLGSNFGVPGRRYQMAILIRDWMRGHPMPRIIAERVRHFADAQPPRTTARVIRETMTDIEQIARFEAPKYLACYVDVLKQFLAEQELMSLTEALPDISMMLELGVSRVTEVSLMSLGLSRGSAVAVGEFIIEDELTPIQCTLWLHRNDISRMDLPKLVEHEIRERVLVARPPTEQM